MTPPVLLSPTTLVLLATLAVAGVLAWMQGGAVGGGILCGALAGAALTGLSVLRLRHAARYRPQQIFRAMVEGFLAKLAVLLFGALAFRGIDQLAARIDSKAFLLTFVSVALVILIPGTIESARILSARRAVGATTVPSNPAGSN